MSTPSQFDPLAHPPHSFRGRIARKLGRTIEPMAVNLLAWCRSLDHRVESVERRMESDEARVNALAHEVRTLEAKIPDVGKIEDRIAAIARQSLESGKKVEAVEVRVDQCFWGRQALVERMNQDDAREAQHVERLSAVEVRAEELVWGREALVERMNKDDATVELITRRLDDVQKQVEEQLPLPLSFGLDYLAMGRRLAALEDQVEGLLSELMRVRDVRSATLVKYPAEASEKAAG